MPSQISSGQAAIVPGRLDKKLTDLGTTQVTYQLLEMCDLVLAELSVDGLESMNRRKTVKLGLGGAGVGLPRA